MGRARLPGQPHGWTAWGWGLAASTLFHLLILGIPVVRQGSDSTGLVPGPLAVRLVSDSPGSLGEPYPTTNTVVEAKAVPAPSSPAALGEARAQGLASPWVPTPEAETPDNYYTKVYLTVSPAPLAPVEIPVPDIAGRRKVELELSLFIDEQGRVRRVRPESPGVMDAYVQAATQAFEATRFKPGEIAGRPVKSVIKVLVEFEQP